jgi:hypothetical protein
VQHGPAGRPELPVVHNSPEAIARLTGAFRRRRGAAGLCAVAAALLVAGCGGGSGTEPQVDVGPNVGQPIALADCNDWNQANTEQRLGTIHQLKDFAGGPVVGNNASSPSGTGAVLDDKQAYDLFENYCKESFARGFKLYKLYERAAAFAGHHE